MSSLTWAPSTLVSIDYFYIFHTCPRCNTVIHDRQQTECCKPHNFQLNFKLKMTVIWNKSQYEVITKSVDVVRELFHAQSDDEWNLWLDGFRRVRKFFLNKSVDYNPAADKAASEKIKKFKELLHAYVCAYSKPTINYNYEMKCRKLSKSFPYEGDKDRYYCFAARAMETED